MGFIDNGGNYYEGMKAHKSHLEVPERPSLYHAWDGNDWVEDTAKKQADDDLILLDKLIQEEIKSLAIESLMAKGKI